MNSKYNLYKYRNLVQVPELCPVSLPQYVTDEVCEKYGTYRKGLESNYFQYSGPTAEEYWPHFNQSLEIQKLRLIFSSKGHFLRSNNAFRDLMVKVAVGQIGVWKNVHLKSYEEYQKLYNMFIAQVQALPLGRFKQDYPPLQPGFTNTIKDELWKEDRYFVQKRLAWLTPYHVQQVTNDGSIGMSKDELKKLLNPSFEWDRAVNEVLKDFKITSLNQAIEENRVYVLYHEYYKNMGTGPYKGRKRVPSTSCVTLYVIDGKGELQVIAIQEGDKQDSPVVTATSGAFAWERAKGLVEVEEFTVGQIIGHFYDCHVRMEYTCGMYRKHMSPTHPLYEIFREHCAYTHGLTVQGYDVLFGVGAAVDLLTTVGREAGKKLMNWAVENEHYDKMDFEKNSKSRGYFNPLLKYFPYRDDGLLLWRGVQEFANKLIHLYYKSDNDVVEDVEIKAFADDMSTLFYNNTAGRNDFHGYPRSFKTREELQSFLERTIFLVIQHAPSNYPIDISVGYYPMGPAILLEDQKAKDYLDILPNTNHILTQMGQGLALSSLRLDKLFDYFNVLSDPQARSLVKSTFEFFHEDIQTTLEKRNAQRYREGKLTNQYMEPRWLTNSIHV